MKRNYNINNVNSNDDASTQPPSSEAITRSTAPRACNNAPTAPCVSLHFQNQFSVKFSPDAFTLCVAAVAHRHAVAYAVLPSLLLSSDARTSFNSCIARWTSRHALLSTHAAPTFTSLALSFSTMAFILSGIICGRRLVL
jgi:hypothetical protein